MRKNLLGIACIMAMLVLQPSVWAEVPVQEGEWEIFVAQDTAEDGAKTPPRTFSCCLSEDQLIPFDPSEPEECDYSDTQTEGERVTYTRICLSDSGRATETSAEVVYKGDTLQGTLHTVIDDPETGVTEMTERIKGKLKGPCPPEN